MPIGHHSEVMITTNLRQEYMRADLNETDVNPDALKQFETWFADALAAKLPEPNAMTLATATRDGKPSARVVLLKSFDEAGFVFYSNYESRKGRELAANPFAALVFHWVELERQVRITGPVSRLTRDDSARYFRARLAGSRLGAWASRQSQVIGSRQVLDDRLRELEQQYRDGEIPLPPYW